MWAFHDYIPRVLAERGIRDYRTHTRALLLKDKEKRKVEAYNEYWFLAEPNPNIRIESDQGVYDLTDKLVNELRTEFTGRFHVSSHVDLPIAALFIQIIPVNSKKKNQAE